MSTSIINSNIENLNVNNNNTPIISKICTNCNQIKPLTEYSKNKLTTDGLQYSCKPCQSIKRKHYQDYNKQINTNKIYNENDVKTCYNCKQIKSIADFSKNQTKSDGLQHICKSCECIIRNNYRNKNRQNNTNRIYTENDIKQCLKCKQQKLYTEFNKCISDKTGLESYCKNCIKNDIDKHFQNLFNKSLNRSIKYGNCSCISIMGCDPDFLKLWFEFQFDDKMNWNNHGTYFHIDHVKPRSLFNIENDNDRRLMNHWSNLSPLEKHENKKKSNTYNDEIELNHKTKILRFLDHLDKTNPDLCKFATESYSNLY